MILRERNSVLPKQYCFYILVAFMGFVSLPVMSVSPLKANVELEVVFAPKSSRLPKLSASEIVSQRSCINSIALEVVVIRTAGDGAASKLHGFAQMNLAAKRANALRRIFLDLGVPDERIYTQADAAVEKVISGQPVYPSGGVAKIEYSGVCNAGGTEAECLNLCTWKRP